MGAVLGKLTGVGAYIVAVLFGKGEPFLRGDDEAVAEAGGAVRGSVASGDGSGRSANGLPRGREGNPTLPAPGSVMSTGRTTGPLPASDRTGRSATIHVNPAPSSDQSGGSTNGSESGMPRGTDGCTTHPAAGSVVSVSAGFLQRSDVEITSIIYTLENADETMDAVQNSVEVVKTGGSGFRVARGLLGKRSRVPDDDTADLDAGLSLACRKRSRIAEAAANARSWRDAAVEQKMHIMWKVATLRAAVLNAAVPGSKFSGQYVIRKQANLEASLADRKLLQHSDNLFGSLSALERDAAASIVCSDEDKPQMTWSMSLDNRRNQFQKTKGRGIMPVVYDDKFGVSSASLSGNVPLDEMNWIIADAYTTINYLLKRAQVWKTVSEALAEDRERISDDLKGAIGEFRSMCRKIRAEVELLGGAPLTEPKAIWKERFPGVI